MTVEDQDRIATLLRSAVDEFQDAAGNLREVLATSEGHMFEIRVSASVTLKLSRACVVSMAELSLHASINKVNKTSESFRSITKSPDRGGPEDH